MQHLPNTSEHLWLSTSYQLSPIFSVILCKKNVKVVEQENVNFFLTVCLFPCPHLDLVSMYGGDTHSPSFSL